MNLGKRIEIRLTELGWERNDLLDRVPDLTAQRLSALIKRDSKRCELDYQIAVALGVTLHWLNSEIPPKLIIESKHDGTASAQAAEGNTPITHHASPLMVAATRLDRAQHVPAAIKASITELIKTLLTAKP
jgi:hypothetical protein